MHNHTRAKPNFTKDSLKLNGITLQYGSYCSYDNTDIRTSSVSKSKGFFSFSKTVRKDNIASATL